jgi:hypothetical protein
MPFGASGDNTESKICSLLARVGLCAVVEDRSSFRSVGGRNRCRFANCHARFGVDTDVVWSFTWARFGGGKDRSIWLGVARSDKVVL